MPLVELAGSGNRNVMDIVNASMELVHNVWRMAPGVIHPADAILLTLYGIAEFKLDPGAQPE